MRSNEQLVPIGGSRSLSKHAMARLTYVESKHNVASIDLGAIHKVQAGDRFHVYSDYIAHQWILTIRQVTPYTSTGVLDPFPPHGPSPTSPT